MKGKNMFSKTRKDRFNISAKSVFAMLVVLAVIIAFAPNIAQNKIPLPADTLPQGFVYLRTVIPDAVLEMRYYTGENFVGERIDGYLEDKCILTADAASALQKVQHELRKFGLGLKVFDAYRPRSAVEHFVRWAKDLEDTRMKEQYYPDVAKENLFIEGYIAARSGHSRGSAVDVTILDFKTGHELDMGSGFDYFGPVSWPGCPDLTAQQRANRMLLQTLMNRHGFEPYEQEWWHFSLRNEPFPDEYFNFPVK